MSEELAEATSRELESESAGRQSGRGLPHRRLRVWARSLEQLKRSRLMKAALQRGFSSLGDQLLRSCASVTLNIAEGANARTAGEKRNAFGIARKEASEAAAVVEALAAMDLVQADDAAPFIQEQEEIAAILTALIKRH